MLSNSEYIASLIQRRRLQMMVHSYIYYVLGENIITDYTWSNWAMNLVYLQEMHPHISANVCYAEAFKDWDGSTGAYLPFDERTINKAVYLLRLNGVTLV